MDARPAIVGLGEVAVDWVSEIPHFPSPDEKIDAISQGLYVGGVTANFLTCVSKLGVTAGFLGAVGDDDHGAFLLDGMHRAGIDTSQVKKTGQSPVNFIMVARDSGEKIIIQSPFMQTTRLMLDQVHDQYIHGARALHTTALHQDLTMKCLQMAKQAGITVSLDLEKQIAIRGAHALAPIIDMVDILLPNKEGAKTLTGTNDVEQAARELLDWGPKIVIITLGAGGCLVTTRSYQERIHAYRVPVVDTTGAGDAFCASFIVAHVIHGLEPRQAAAFANAVSALKVQHLGATSGLPTWDEARRFQATHGINQEAT